MPLQQKFFETSWDMTIPEIEPVRLGFIGCGAMAEFAVFPALYLAPIVLKGVCDLDKKRAEYLSEKFCQGHCYTDYREMWTKEDIEAVSIQLQPGSTRDRVVKEALERGLHVFMPKPPTTSYQSTVALAELSDKHSKNLMVNFESRFSYGVRMARKVITRPEFGKLSQGLFSFCTGTYKDRLEYRHDAPYKDTVHAYLLDFTPHHLDLARYLCGAVTKMSLYHNEWNGESTNAVSMQFESGAVGVMQLNSNRIWWRNYDRVELTGQGEYVILDGLWNIKHYTLDQNTFTENYRDERSTELTGDGFALREFAASIREHRKPVSSIQDCCATMELYQHIYDAVCAGKDGVILNKKGG
jgi:myo-inositol 2-dehydrogenase/D-chiro-inositol 1-dehydrogenase